MTVILEFLFDIMWLRFDVDEYYMKLGQMLQ